MTTKDLYSNLLDSGFNLTINGDRIKVTPVEALTDEWRTLIRQHKPGLMELLRAEQGATNREGTQPLSFDEPMPPVAIPPATAGAELHMPHAAKGPDSASTPSLTERGSTPPVQPLHPLPKIEPGAIVEAEISVIPPATPGASNFLSRANSGVKPSDRAEEAERGAAAPAPQAPDHYCRNCAVGDLILCRDGIEIRNVHPVTRADTIYLCRECRSFQSFFQVANIAEEQTGFDYHVARCMGAPDPFGPGEWASAHVNCTWRSAMDAKPERKNAKW